MTRALIVPAAGVGSRLRYSGPKALFPLNGRPLLDHLIDLYRDHVDRVVLVVRPVDRCAFERHLAARDSAHDHEYNDHLSHAHARAHERTHAVSYAIVEQPEATGMLDAILLAREALVSSPPDRVWITWCDQVAISRETVTRLRALSDEERGAALVFPTVEREEPYIHLERAEERGRITAIRHRREGDAMPAVGESDAGVFSLSREAYFDLLPRFADTVAPGAVTRERNFLPFIPWLAALTQAPAAVRTFRCASAIEAIGINTPDEASLLAGHLRER
jgi:bifunctional N-acetylglucosamine-1-phosphate-uridyltransferase/glucosamine-1-phosphate-acetyltransferase GlmU-like protein